MAIRSHRRGVGQQQGAPGYQSPAADRGGSAAPPQPWLLEDFSTYASTANMISDPRGIYSNAEDVNTGQMVLDTTVGYGTLTQSMRYDFPDRTNDAGRCGDYTIQRRFSPMANPTTSVEAWVEVVAKTSATFTTTAPAGWTCASNPDYKFFFGGVDVSSRFEFKAGTFGHDWVGGYPANTEAYDIGNWNLTSVPKMFDGNWHTIRVHWSCAAGGPFQWAIDGVTYKNTTVVNPGCAYLNRFIVGANLNQGPGAAQSLWWGRIKIHNTDPGWTF